MIDWSKLVSQGRAKAIGVSWSEAELKARYELGIPAEYVRQGILTKEDYDNALKQGPIEQKTKEEVMKEAKEEGISATPDAPKEVVADLVQKAKEKKAKVAPAKKPAIKSKAKPAKAGKR
jgi:hypothetical protein